ncbi:hypothetical protein Droror1_Dr00024787 [Drosera rotundifolia]
MASSDPDTPPQFRHYHPFQDQIPLPLPIQTLYTLPTSPDFLYPEQSSLHSRTWSENLTYYTGTAYLGGAIIGGVRGSIEGIRGWESGDSRKIRVNRVLNAGGMGGRRMGNVGGVMGLLFAGFESGVKWWRGGVDDWVNSVEAGLGTGVVYRAAKGVRSAAIAGAVGGVVAGLGVAGKQAVKRYVPV